MSIVHGPTTDDQMYPHVILHFVVYTWLCENVELVFFIIP